MSPETLDSHLTHEREFVHHVTYEMAQQSLQRVKTAFRGGHPLSEDWCNVLAYLRGVESQLTPHRLHHLKLSLYRTYRDSAQ